MRTVCLFGGTFDPVHNGHLAAARQGAGRLGAERTIFIPALVAPHKDARGTAGPAHRLNMLRLALREEPDMECSDTELNRPGPSYTIDTVRMFRTMFPGTVLAFLTGTDALEHLHLWKDIAALVRECRLVLLARPGYAPAVPAAVRAVLGPEAAARLGADLLAVTTPDISATRVRELVRSGGDISGVVPPGVADYIREHRLYA